MSDISWTLTEHQLPEEKSTVIFQVRANAIGMWGEWRHNIGVFHNDCFQRFYDGKAFKAQNVSKWCKIE